MGSSSLVARLAGGALVALVTGFLFFVAIDRYPLWDPDEARHAEIAREMAEASGLRPLFLPTLRFEPYREKPPPYYWLVVTAYRVAGIGEAAARGVSGAAGLVAVLAIYAWAVPRRGVPAAVAAGLVAATTAGWVGVARFANLDMTFTALIVVGVLAGLAWVERPAPRRPPVTPYLAAGAATLVKGPLGAILVGGPLVLAAVLHRPRPGWRELGLGRGVALAGAVVVLVYGPIALLDWSYVQGFAATHLRRLGPSSPHAAPIYFYLIWLPLLFLPWTLLALPALARSVRDPTSRSLVAWVLFVPAVLTLATGKLATYALSGLAPLALLLGPELARVTLRGPEASEETPLQVVGWLAVGLLASAALAAPALGFVLPVALGGRLLIAAVALVVATALAVALRRGRAGLVPGLVFGATLGIFPLVALHVLPVLGALRSDREAARLVAAAGNAPVIAFGAQAHSMTFYLGTVPLLTDDTALVRDLFAADDPVFLVTGRRHFATIESLLGARAYVWLATPRRRLYANRPRPDPVPESP